MINQAFRAYRPASRLGSSPRRNAHSSPVLLHPARGAADPICGEVERRSDLDADRNCEPPEVSDDPTLSLRLPERDEQDVGPRRVMRSIRAASSSGVGSWNGGHSVPTILRPGYRRKAVSPLPTATSSAPPKEEQTISPQGRLSAELEDQVRASHSLLQRESATARSPDQGAPSAKMKAAPELISRRSRCCSVSIA